MPHQQFTPKQQNGGLASLLGNTPQVDVPDPLFQRPLQQGLLGLLAAINPQSAQALFQQQAQRQGAIQRAQATNVGLQQRSNLAKATQRRFEATELRATRQFEAEEEGRAATLRLRRRQVTLEETNAVGARELRESQIRLNEARADSLRNPVDKVADRQSRVALSESNRRIFSVYKGDPSTNDPPLFNEMTAAFEKPENADDPSTNEDERFLAAMRIFQEAKERGDLVISDPLLVETDSASLDIARNKLMQDTIRQFNDWLTKKTAEESKRIARGIREQRITPRVRKQIERVTPPPIRGPK